MINNIDINKIVVSNNEIEIYFDKENSKEIFSDDSDDSHDFDQVSC